MEPPYMPFDSTLQKSDFSRYAPGKFPVNYRGADV